MSASIAQAWMRAGKKLSGPQLCLASIVMLRLCPEHREWYLRLRLPQDQDIRPYPKTSDTRKANIDEALILLSGATKSDEMCAQENFSADNLPCLDKIGFCNYYLFR